MNQPFLDKVAEHILGKYSEKISDIIIVLPNKRAGLFLKKFLSEKFRKTIWSPKIYSIEDFIAELSGLTIADPMTLLFEFYHIYKKIEGEKAHPPEEFMGWATILLNDFNEIGLYCVNGNELFSYLNEIRVIELWNPQKRELSEFQKQYLYFWKSLGTLYKDFSEHLLQKQQVYQGLAYRVAVEKIKDKRIKVKGENSKPIIFCGFNALTKAEEIIIDYFLNNNRGEILWDTDNYYMENENQEAGRFLRKNKERKRDGEHGFLWEFDILKSDEKEIEIIGVAGNVAQTKVAAEILTSPSNSLPIVRGGSGSWENTAIVLADESLLIPMLNSLPENINSVNVTMGYPLQNSPLNDFWNSLFILHENANLSGGSKEFYHKNIMQVLSHPYLAFSEEMVSVSYKIISEIKADNRIYVSGEWLKDKFKDFNVLLDLFSDWKNEPEIALKTTQRLIKQHIDEKGIEGEFMTRYLEVFNQLEWLQKEYKIIQDLRTLRLIFNQIVSGCKVPFSGEPLQGLQIMGMLETRTLDFETVILLSANEDILPAGKSHNSFIPYDVKKHFGLPTYSERDAVFAYHFYRLIQRAKKIYILYNNDNSKSFGAGTSEKSRFITQIREELHKINLNLKITSKIYSFRVPKNENVLTVEKNDTIINRLDEIAEKGFSPTGINTFLNCPLDFYFKYIIGLHEEDEVEETVEADKFGNFIHDALENLYKPFTGKIISADDILLFANDSDDLVKSAFLKQFSERDIRYGKNFLALKVAQKFVSNFLKIESEFVKSKEKTGEFLTILDLEKSLETTIIFNEKKIKLKGKADRIDMLGGTIRLIDYKTGKMERSDLSIESAEITLLKKPKPKAVQLLMYALMCKMLPWFESFERLKVGIVALKKPSEYFMPLLINKNAILNDDSLQIFEGELKKIVGSMYDCSQIFEHNEESEHCEFCR